MLKNLIINTLSQNGYVILNKSIIKYFGSHEVAMILSFFIDKISYTNGEDFYYTIENIKNDTFLSEKKIRECIKILIKENILILKEFKGLPPKQFYNINFDKLVTILGENDRDNPCENDRDNPCENDRDIYNNTKYDNTKNNKKEKKYIKKEKVDFENNDEVKLKEICLEAKKEKEKEIQSQFNHQSKYEVKVLKSAAAVSKQKANALTLREQNKSQLENEFNLFYNLYPRKEAKETARKTFYKLREKQNIPFDNILNAVGDLIKNIGENGTKKEFIPYPSSWLNANDFLDCGASEPMNLPQNNQGCLNEIKTMLKKMADTMNEKFKENPSFKESKEYPAFKREILFTCIFKIKEICNQNKCSYYKYYGFYDDELSRDEKKYKWYLNKSFGDWLKEALNENNLKQIKDKK